MSLSLHIIYASTSGNTEHVVGVLEELLKEKDSTIIVTTQRAELAKADDFLRGDLLILGSGTWNTGGMEGQLNMYMDELLKRRAKDVDLKKKPITFISLGDDRYYFTTRCTEHFLKFQRDHSGMLLLPPLIIVNEPYEQTERIRTWGTKLLEKLKSLK